MKPGNPAIAFGGVRPACPRCGSVATVPVVIGIDDDPSTDSRGWLELAGRARPWICEDCGRKFNARTERIYPNAYVLGRRARMVALILLVILGIGLAVAALFSIY